MRLQILKKWFNRIMLVYAGIVISFFLVMLCMAAFIGALCLMGVL
jgi:hypothetical protein